MEWSHIVGSEGRSVSYEKNKRENQKEDEKRWTVSASLFIGIKIQGREKEGRNGSDKTTCVFRNLLE